MRRTFVLGCIVLVTMASCSGPSGGGTLATATPTETPAPELFSGSSSSTQSVPDGDESPDNAQPSGDESNPFLNPPPDMDSFPVPSVVPTDAGQYGTPREGPWSVVNQSGSLSCPGVMELTIPESPPEPGTITVLEPDQSFVASGLGSIEEGTISSITFTANPPVQGRYMGEFTVSQQGVSITITYHLLVGWPEYMLGYLESDYEAQGVQCHVERTFELFYAGD